MAQEITSRASASSPSKWPTKYASGKLRQALVDRLTLSEAVDAVGRLISAFPNGGQQSSKGYIGALSALLLEYPRQIALECADPVKGVARATKFLPTIADIVGWCDERKISLESWVKSHDMIEQKAKQVVYPIGGKPGDEFENRGAATTSGLRARYGIICVPRDWSAIEVCQAAHKYGAGLQEHIDQVIARGVSKPQQSTCFSRAGTHARLLTEEELKTFYPRKTTQTESSST